MSVTEVRPDSFATREKLAQVSRRSLMLLGAGGLFLCFALRFLRIGASFDQMPTLFSANLFPWAVFAVALWRIAKARSSDFASRSDTVVVLGVALACVLLSAEPSLAGLGIAMGVLGTYLVICSYGERNLIAAGICFLALCTNLSIAPLIFRLGYSQIIDADLALLQTAINLVGAPITVTPAGLVSQDGMWAQLVGGCSSFQGISAAVLVHMGWAMVFRTEVGWRDGVAVAATICLATLINITRLTLTASGHEAYAFWHGLPGTTPLGGQIFWFAQTLALLSGGYFSATWAARPRQATSAST
jgi:hypothetical protein